MTEKRFTMDNPNDWGFPITDNDTGKVYSCASNQLMKDLCDVINKIVKENEQLKRQIGNLEHTRDFCADVLADFERIEKENKELKQQLESEHTMLDNAILLERTRMGKNSLIQYKEAIM